MLANYHDFNKKFGLKNLQAFVIPKIMDLNTIVIPYYSMLYVFNPNSKHYVTGDHYFIKHAKRKFVVNTMEYNQPPFPIKRAKVNENKILRDIKKEHPGTKLMKYDKFLKFLVNKPNDIKYTIPTINFNTVHEGSRYKSTITEYYQMFKNSITTLVNNIVEYDNKVMIKGKHDINHFVILEIPDTLYSLPILEKYSKYETPTNEMMKLFFDTSRLLLLELIKLLDDDLTKSSVFYRLIEEGKASNVTLVLGRYDKGVFVNLKDLYSFLKISSYSNNNKVQGIQLQKLFFFMIKTLLLTPGFAPEDIDDNKYGDKLALGIGKLSDILESDTDEDLDTDIVIKTVEKHLKEENSNVIDIMEEVEDVSGDVTTINTYKSKYDDVDNIMDIKPSIESETESLLNTMLANGQLTKAKHKKLLEVSKEGLNRPSPFKDGKKIKDLLVIEPKELELSDKDIKIPTTKTYGGKEAFDTIGAINKKYMNNIYKKDLVSAISSISKVGLIVKDITRTEHDEALGSYEEYVISVNDLGKSSYDLKVLIPKVDVHGEYMISNNPYVLKTNRADLPIKKIDYNKVSLSSGYGKLSVVRSPKMSLDKGAGIKKQLSKLNDAGKIKNFVAGTLKLVDTKVPNDYSLFSRYIKSFTKDSYVFSFSYLTRGSLVGDTDLETVEGNGKYVVCGKVKGGIIVMDFDSELFIYRNKEYHKIGDIITLLELDTSKLKNEFSMVQVGKTFIPVSILLSYYMGLENFLKSIKADYTILEGGRAKVPAGDDIVVRFKFNTLIIKRSTPLNNMLLYGLTHDDKVIRKMDIDVLNNKELFKTVFNEMGLTLLSTVDIELYETMFIDPVTESRLLTMGEPTAFVGLLTRASEMLLDDYYGHPTSMKGFTMAGYDRVSQFVYKTLVLSIKKKKAEEFFGRSRLTLDPYATWRIINEDSSAALIEDINPVALLKQHEDSTYLGFGSRSKESLGVASREVHKDDIGIISESSKDSSDVGITAYMSANPLLAGVRGFKKDIDGELDITNILSTSAMLAPFSMNDDPKRSTRVK